MARHELRYEGFQRVDGMDAYELRLGWARDGERLGLVTPVVSGGPLFGDQPSSDAESSGIGGPSP